jgi:hypothetical protein
MTATATMTPAELAPVLGTDSKTLRKFLRSCTPKEDQPGKGGRWSISATKKDITSMKKRFNEWNAAEQKARAERAAAKAAEAEAIAAEEPAEEDLELEEN